LATPAKPVVDAPSRIAPQRIYTKLHEIEIPLNKETYPTAFTGDSEAEAVILYVSGNRGLSWVRAQKRAAPATAGPWP